MAQYTTLLPADGGKRTGHLYDNPDGSGQEVVLSSKLIESSEGERFVQVRVWTAEADLYTQVAFDVATLAEVARADDAREQRSWEKLREALALRG